MKRLRRQLYYLAMRRLEGIEQWLYQYSAKRGNELRLYRREAQFTAWLWGQTWAQNCFGGDKVGLIQRFLSGLALSKACLIRNEQEVIQQVLLGDALRARWKPRFMRIPWAKVAPLVTMQGQEIFLAAHGQKKGVILVASHTYAIHFVPYWLNATSTSPPIIIRPAKTAAKRWGIAYSTASEPFIYARQLHAANECLQQGGTVLILPDGTQGGKGIDLPFYQRSYSFRTSFAELALRAEASVIPLYAALDACGKVEITFYPPFDAGDEGQPFTQRCALMAKQYVAFLQQTWESAPGNVTVGIMREYLMKPLTGVQEEPDRFDEM